MSDRPGISVVIVARDEAQNVKRCVSSVRWADEVLVVDTGSDDSTPELAEEAGARIERLPWEGFGPTKGAAVGLATHDWVLSLDADEVVPEELGCEILALLAAGPEHAGYRVRRRNHYLGREIRHAGWNRDRVLRLFDRRRGAFNRKAVHESVAVDGTTGMLQHALLHYPCPDLATHRAKMRRYAEIIAGENHGRGRRRPAAVAGLLAAFRFVRMYVLQLGILDGRAGLLLCSNSAYGVYLKYRLRGGDRA